MNIYVSNLDKQVSSEQLRSLFTPHGEVKSAEVAIDSFTNQPKGFAYVEMPQDEQAREAISTLDQTEINGCLISVREAIPREVHKGSYTMSNGAANHFRFKKY